MAADLTYDVQVKTTDAERNLTNLQKSVVGINGSFIRLRETIATLSLGATIASALQLADGIQDLSDATGVATANILGFSKAVSASGGSADTAHRGLLRLVNSIGEAADGSNELQQAFRDVGVSIDDLRTLSEQDILAKTIKGLSVVDDVAKRSTLTTKLLGKEFRGVSLQGVAGDYDAAVAASQKYSEAIKAAAATQDKLEQTIKGFQLALLKSIQPLADFMNSIDPEKIQIFIDRLVKIGSALGALFIIGKIVSMLEAYIIATRAAAISTSALAAAQGNMFAMAMLGAKQVGQAFNLFSAAIVSANTGIGVLSLTLKSLATGFLRMIPLIGTAIVAYQLLDGTLEALTGKNLAGWFDESAAGLERLVSSNFPKLAEILNALGEKMGMAPPPSVQQENERELKRIQERARAAEEDRKRQEQIREVLDRQAESRAKINLELQHNIDNMAIGLSRQTEAIAFETRMIELSRLSNSISEDQVEIYKAQSEASVAKLAKLKDLEQQQEKLRVQLQFAKDEDKAGIVAQIQANDKLIGKVNEYYNAHFENLDYYITRLQTARKLDAARVQDMENMKKAIEDQISRQQQLGDIIRGIQDKKIDLQFETGLIGKTPFQKTLARIAEDSRKAGLEAGRQFAESFGGEDGLTPEKAQELADGLARIREEFQILTEIQTANANAARSWEAGWTEAYANFVDSAWNASEAARTTFETATRGMEDAMVKFVQTGKLSFSDLANSIMADLVRIATRRAIAGLGDFFGISTMFGGGKALGGPVDPSKAYMVGENGPELFVPQSAGSIIPNNKLGGGSGSSIGSTAITYNINAVDASSFRQLVAQDPQFIYNITEVGRRSVPSRRLA